MYIVWVPAFIESRGSMSAKIRVSVLRGRQLYHMSSLKRHYYVECASGMRSLPHSHFACSRTAHMWAISASGQAINVHMADPPRRVGLDWVASQQPCMPARHCPKSMPGTQSKCEETNNFLYLCIPADHRQVRMGTYQDRFCSPCQKPLDPTGIGLW